MRCSAASSSPWPSPPWPSCKPLARSMNTMVGRLSTMFDAQAKQVEALRQQAQTDAVTGLLNRRQFMLDAHQRFESSAGETQALLLWRVQDLDGLNRRLGHAAVDQLLRTLAHTLGSAPSVDDKPLLGRLNGSDFALALAHADAGALAQSHDGDAARGAWRGRRAGVGGGRRGTGCTGRGVGCSDGRGRSRAGAGRSRRAVCGGGQAVRRQRADAGRGRLAAPVGAGDR